MTRGPLAVRGSESDSREQPRIPVPDLAPFITEQIENARSNIV